MKHPSQRTITELGLNYLNYSFMEYWKVSKNTANKFLGQKYEEDDCPKSITSEHFSFQKSVNCIDSIDSVNLWTPNFSAAFLPDIPFSNYLAHSFLFTYIFSSIHHGIAAVFLELPLLLYYQEKSSHFSLNLNSFLIDLHVI